MKNIILLIAIIAPITVIGQADIQCGTWTQQQRTNAINANFDSAYIFRIDTPNVVLRLDTARLNLSGGMLLNLRDGSRPNINIIQTDSISQDNSDRTGTDYELTTTYTAFKFTASSDQYIASFGIYAKRGVDSITNPTGYFKMFIYTDNAGSPGAQIGSVSEYGYYGWFTTSFQEIRTQTARQTLVNGTDYWIVIVENSAIETGQLFVDTDNTGTNNVATSSNGSSWSVGSGASLRFKTYLSQSYNVFSTNTNHHGVTGISNTEYGGYFESFFDPGAVSYSTLSDGFWSTTIYGAGGRRESTYNFGGIDKSTYGKGSQSYSINNTGAQILSDSLNALYARGRDTASKFETFYTSGSGIADGLILSRTTDGTVSTGIGGSLAFELPNKNKLKKILGRYSMRTDAVIGTTIDASHEFTSYNNGEIHTDYVISYEKQITDEVADTLFYFDLPDGRMVGGQVDYTIYARYTPTRDSLQVYTGTIRFSALNYFPDTYTTAIDNIAPNFQYAESVAATTLTESWDIVTGVNAVYVRTTVNTSINVSLIRIVLNIRTAGDGFTFNYKY